MPGIVISASMVIRPLAIFVSLSLRSTWPPALTTANFDSAGA
jgi:hypothetical protein